MARRRPREAALVLALALAAGSGLPGCLAPRGFPIDAKTAYGTPVLAAYAFYYDLCVLCEAFVLVYPGLVVGSAGGDPWQPMAIVAMPLALAGSAVAGTLTLPVVLLLFGGSFTTDWSWHASWSAGGETHSADGSSEHGGGEPGESEHGREPGVSSGAARR